MIPTFNPVPSADGDNSERCSPTKISLDDARFDKDGDIVCITCYQWGPTSPACEILCPNCKRGVKPAEGSCPNCATWGDTIPETETRIVCGKEITYRPTRIPCGVCGRMTWPNLGVNCPAGSAVSMGMSNAIEMQRALMPDDGQAGMAVYARSRPYGPKIRMIIRCESCGASYLRGTKHQCGDSRHG